MLQPIVDSSFSISVLYSSSRMSSTIERIFSYVASLSIADFSAKPVSSTLGIVSFLSEWSCVMTSPCSFLLESRMASRSVSASR